MDEMEDDIDTSDRHMTLEQAQELMEETGQAVDFINARTGQPSRVTPEDQPEDDYDTPGTGEHSGDDDES